MTIPTDRSIQARWPDIIMFDKTTNNTWIIDVACAWEPFLMEREAHKSVKYLELAADLGKRKPRWSITTMAVVVGSLGKIESLGHQLAKLGLWSQTELTEVIKELQYQAIKAGAQLLRRHSVSVEQ